MQLVAAELLLDQRMELETIVFFVQRVELATIVFFLKERARWRPLLLHRSQTATTARSQ